MNSTFTVHQSLKNTPETCGPECIKNFLVCHNHESLKRPYFRMEMRNMANYTGAKICLG